MTFIYVQQPTPRCPSCNGVEATKTTCRHCDYEYKNGDDTGCLIFFAVLALLPVGLFFMFTMFEWLGGYEHKSLLEVLAGQLKWLSKLRVW